MSAFRLGPMGLMRPTALLNVLPLLTEEAARTIGVYCRELRPGGIYILGLHLRPLGVDEQDTMSWTERRGGTKVTATLARYAPDLRAGSRSFMVLAAGAPGSKKFTAYRNFQFRTITRHGNFERPGSFGSVAGTVRQGL